MKTSSSIRRNQVACATRWALFIEISADFRPEAAAHDIARFLRGRGFDRQQGSVYFGGDSVDVVLCQNTVLELSLEYEWFGPSVRDIRMLRIADNNDLMSTVELALRMKARMM